MTRRFRLALAAGALLALLVGASPAAAAGDRAAYGECVVHHATTEGFGRDVNPGTHRGFAGWTDCEHA